MSDTTLMDRPRTRRTALDDNDVRRPLPSKQMKATRTVYVACKLPSGLRLQTDTMCKVNEAIPGGFRTVDQAVPDEGLFEARGISLPAGHSAAYIVHGFAITPGCPAELWEKWYETRSHLQVVKNNLVMAHEDRNWLVSWCKSHRDQKSGLEPVDPNNPPQIDRRFKITRGTRDNEDVSDE